MIVALPTRVTTFRKLPDLYRSIKASVSPVARIMINDSARLYYFLGLGGVTIPNESVEVIVDIVKKYFRDYLLLEQVQEDGYIAATPNAFQFDV